MTRLAIAVALAVATGAARGEELPRLEAGVGLASVVVPTYRGSAHYGSITVPFPYFVYRGDRVRLTRGGIRARAEGWEHLSVGLSGSMEIPGRDGEDPAREGMPDVEPMFEIGPSIDWTVARGNGSWCFCVPIRAAFYTGSGPSAAGWIANPQLRLRTYNASGPWNLSTTLAAGPIFAARQNHATYYDVAAEQARPDRPEYHARGGYSGTRTTAYLGVRRARWSFGIGVSGDWLSGAEFADSPLVSERTSVTAGLGIIYSFWRQGTASDDAADNP